MAHLQVGQRHQHSGRDEDRRSDCRCEQETAFVQPRARCAEQQARSREEGEEVEERQAEAEPEGDLPRADRPTAQHK